MFLEKWLGMLERRTMYCELEPFMTSLEAEEEFCSSSCDPSGCSWKSDLVCSNVGLLVGVVFMTSLEVEEELCSSSWFSVMQSTFRAGLVAIISRKGRIPMPLWSDRRLLVLANPFSLIKLATLSVGLNYLCSSSRSKYIALWSCLSSTFRTFRTVLKLNYIPRVRNNSCDLSLHLAWHPPRRVSLVPLLEQSTLFVGPFSTLGLAPLLMCINGAPSPSKSILQNACVFSCF